jgi:lambda family phage minor tail protein L
VSNSTDKIFAELAKLVPSSLIELFCLDATEIGGDRLYFYDGTNEVVRPGLPNPPIFFQKQVYNPMPIQVKGFELRTKGELPRPTIRFSNIMGSFTALSLLYEDLMGAKIIRKRTLRKYLDDGSDPDPTAELPEDIFVVDRKSSETKQFVEYELGTDLDVEGAYLPRRQVVANVCGWQYRGAECGFAENRFVSTAKGTVYANQNYRGQWSDDITYNCLDVVYVWIRGLRYFFILDAPHAHGELTMPPNSLYWVPDQCGKLLSSCKLRQDPNNYNNPLTFGAFPAVNKMPL